jgi:pyrroloquinoline quinone biosynthesis protein B
MQVRVLGSAAGGGFPQWNCGCPNCAGLRAGTVRARARTQESVAISADGARWFLLNASPEIRAQVEAFPGLHPKRPRHSPIEGILLTNGDLDHCLGLLSLRESHPLVVYATRAVEEGFTREDVLYRTLQRFDGQVTWRHAMLDTPFDLMTHAGERTGLIARAWAVAGKLPVHLEGLRSPSPEDNIGLEIRDEATGATLVYLASVGQVRDREVEAALRASCLFFDGTFWSSDELRSIDPNAPRAEQMAHLPMGGSEGSLARLRELPPGRRFFIHINNSNPVLREDSPEYAGVREAGWDLAWDGMELTL